MLITLTPKINKRPKESETFYYAYILIFGVNIIYTPEAGLPIYRARRKVPKGGNEDVFADKLPVELISGKQSITLRQIQEQGPHRLQLIRIPYICH
jgi:hypothetical protein